MSGEFRHLYRGLCEASAAVYIGPEHFAVATDETNILRIYRRGATDFGLEVPLRVDGDRKADLEGAARIGDMVYWISSHSLPGSQKVKSGADVKSDRKRRRGLVATRIEAGPDGPTLIQTGFAPDVASPLLAAMGQAMDAGALNIEGLAATPDGRLMLGLRNLIGTMAMVATLDNPEGVLQGEVARFGAISLLDLQGKGIRSLEEYPGGYLMVAGPEDDSGSFAIFRWPGPGFAPVALHGIDFADLNPEALMVIPGGTALHILCDDGSKRCSDVTTPLEERAFHSIEVPLASLRPRPVP